VFELIKGFAIKPILHITIKIKQYSAVLRLQYKNLYSMNPYTITAGDMKLLPLVAEEVM